MTRNAFGQSRPESLYERRRGSDRRRTPYDRRRLLLKNPPDDDRRARDRRSGSDRRMEPEWGRPRVVVARYVVSSHVERRLGTRIDDYA